MEDEDHYGRDVVDLCSSDEEVGSPVPGSICWRDMDAAKIRQNHALCCVSTDCCHRMSTQAPSDSQQEEWLSDEDEEEDDDSALLSEPASACAAAAPQHAWTVLDRPKLQKMQVYILRILNLLEHACTVCKSVLSSMCTIAQHRGISSGAHIATSR